MNKILTLFVFIVLFSSAGCTAKPETGAGKSATYDIAGNWEYTLTTPDGNVYDDGTLEFTGTLSQGDWTQFNYYEIEYSGTYTVNGDRISLAGDETWQGRFVDATHITGRWQNDEAGGDWTAVRK